SFQKDGEVFPSSPSRGRPRGARAAIAMAFSRFRIKWFGETMPDYHLTVISHFRNEEIYLPYWLSHHTTLFDHGILIDYDSTDRSAEIIRTLAPSWEIRPSRNRLFHSLSVDAEIMDIERTISGWKMCLNATEFVIHYDLKQFLQDFEARHPGAL